MKFKVDGIPVPQGSMRALVRGTRAVVIHDNSEKLKAWRKAVGTGAMLALRKDGGLLAACPISLYLVFHLPKPKTVKRDKPFVKPDLDKLCRAVCDALEGVLYDNDSQIVHLGATKRYANFPSGTLGPGVYVEMEAE